MFLWTEVPIGTEKNHLGKETFLVFLLVMSPHCCGPEETNQIISSITALLVPAVNLCVFVLIRAWKM